LPAGEASLDLKPCSPLPLNERILPMLICYSVVVKG